MIGYVPFTRTLSTAGDRRRFPRYASIRGLEYQVGPDLVDPSIVVVSYNSDLGLWAKAPPNIKVVIDLPDAYLDERFGFRTAFRGLAKWLAGDTRSLSLDYRRSLEACLRRADAVVCSTDEQLRKIRNLCDNVHAILDFHGELGSYSPIAQRNDREMDLVWEGLPPSLPALESILPAIEDLAGNRRVGLHVVTDLRAPRYMNRFLYQETSRLVARWGFPVSLYQWDVRILPAVARSCDLALVPVDLRDSMATGKPENRLRLFWRLGLPVVASASPAHIRAVRSIGMTQEVLCETIGDWKETLLALAEDPVARKQIATVGHTAAMSIYSDEAIADSWDRVLESIGFTGGR